MTSWKPSKKHRSWETRRWSSLQLTETLTGPIVKENTQWWDNKCRPFHTTAQTLEELLRPEIWGKNYKIYSYHQSECTVKTVSIYSSPYSSRHKGWSCQEHEVQQVQRVHPGNVFTFQKPHHSCSSEEEADTLRYQMTSFYDLLVSATKDQFENHQFLNGTWFNIPKVIRLFWGHAILQLSP